MKSCKLRDIAEIQAGPFGTQLHKSDYVSYGIMMLNAKNVGVGCVDLTSIDYVSEQSVNKLPQYVLKEGDILFGRAGSIERHIIIERGFPKAFQGTNCIRVRCCNKSLARYLYYFLSLPHLKKRILLDSGGSTLPYISSDILENLDIILPERNYAELGIDLLTGIDSAIKHNRQINDNLAAYLATVACPFISMGSNQSRKAMHCLLSSAFFSIRERILCAIS